MMKDSVSGSDGNRSLVPRTPGREIHEPGEERKVRMKVLMISPQPFFEPRGTPISVHQRLQALSRMGVQVDLVAYHIGEDVSIPGVAIHRIPRVPFIKHVKIGPSLAKLFLDIFVLFTSVGLLLRRRYDVVHSHEEAAFFAMVLAFLFDTQHVYDMHSSLPKQLENFKYGNVWPIVKLFELLERAVLRTASSVITIGDDLSDYVKAIAPNAQVWTIENLPLDQEGDGAHPAVEHMRDQIARAGELAIVYTGTFERYQGLELLLEAFALLLKRVPSAVLVLVGGNSKQISRLEGIAAQMGLSHRARFVGMTSTSEAVAYLDIGHVLISPRIEGTSIPLKIYSYLKAGKAILATNIHAHRLLLNEDTALLVDPTAESIADGLADLLEREDFRAQLSQKARAYVAKNHDPERYLLNVNRMYRSVFQSAPLMERTVSSPEK